MTISPDDHEAHRRFTAGYFTAGYFTSLTVAGVRCFGPETRLDLTDNGRPAKWTIILGENGVGKTTLLQCLWAMTPYTDLKQPGSPVSLPTAVAHFPLGWRELLRVQAPSLTVAANLVVGQPLGSTTLGKEIKAHVTSTMIGASSINYDYTTSVLCAGYAALRRAGEDSVEKKPDGIVGSPFSDDATLVSGSEWFLRADYAANTTGDARATARRDRIRAALIALLPDVDDIRVAGLDEKTPQPRVEVQTPYGWVPMRALSLGYRSMISWVVDLASRMFEAYPDSADPLAEPAIALVDEIDLHLHPRWQREITAHLDRLFPNVQFIATAHSPLVVQAAGVTNVAVLRRVDDHVEIINDPEQIRGWRVDQILTSDLFGLSSARPVEVEKLLERQRELVLVDAPTDAQKAELAEVDAKLSGLAPGETAKDRATWNIVRGLADRLAGGAGR